MEPILQLYPLPSREIPLEGAYLAHHLRSVADRLGKPCVYANFITSLDGRIAVEREDGTGLMVPRETANERDWRLYQELAAQADLILSSGRYLREWALGRAQELLQVDDPRFADLREWRKAHGLKPTADIGVISSRLEFPIPAVLSAGGRRLVAITAGQPDAERVKLIREGGGEVVVAGEADVEGPELMRQLTGLGYHTIYSAAGPRILQLLTAGGVLDRLYLTWAGVLLGGAPFATLYEGPRLVPPAGFRPSSIYLDHAGLGGTGQMFLAYDRV